MKNIFELITQDWKGNELIQIACTRICESIFNRENHPDYYTFNDFKEVVNQDDANVAEAVMYLATPRVRVLKLNLMYECRGLILDLPQEQVVNYSNNKKVFHPGTGEEMTEEEILICFLPGQLLNKN